MHESWPKAQLPKPARGLVWNPYFQILLTVLLTSAAQILLKIGFTHCVFCHSVLRSP
jgi:hypothetical protein